MFGRKKTKTPAVIQKTFGGLRQIAKDCDYNDILDILKTVPKEEWDKDTEARNSKAKAGGNTNLDVRALMLKYKSLASTGAGFIDYEKNETELLNKLKPYLDEIISQVKNFYGYETEGNFIDIGTPESYAYAKKFFERKPISA